MTGENLSGEEFTSDFCLFWFYVGGEAKARVCSWNKNQRGVRSVVPGVPRCSALIADQHATAICFPTLARMLLVSSGIILFSLKSIASTLAELPGGFRTISSTPPNSPLYGLHSVRDSNKDLHLRAGAANGDIGTVVLRIVCVADFRPDDEPLPQPLHASADHGSRRLTLSSGSSVPDHQSSARKRTHGTVQPSVIAK